MRGSRATAPMVEEWGMRFLIRRSKSGGRVLKQPGADARGVARVVASTDGFVGADGQAGWAFVARGEGVDVAQRGELGPVPPHVAEWVAASEALAWAERTLTPGDELVLRTDSALVAKGLAARKPAMSGEAAELRAACRQRLARLAERGVKAKVERVPRETNEEADRLSRRHR
jgi:ribonuclease HI